MFSKFEALDCDKKRHIINAAMTEFVRGGFEKASMNTVVEQAGISKDCLLQIVFTKKVSIQPRKRPSLQPVFLRFQRHL
jgi:hypothetical protein